MVIDQVYLDDINHIWINTYRHDICLQRKGTITRYTFRFEVLPRFAPTDTGGDGGFELVGTITIERAGFLAWPWQWR